MIKSEEIFENVSKVFDGESPNIFSNKVFKQVGKHPKLDQLKTISIEIMEVANDFELDPEYKIKHVQKLRTQLLNIWKLD